MAWRVNHLQLQLADVDGLACTERLDRAHGRIRLQDLELRVAAIGFACSQHLGGDIARNDFRTGNLLQLRDAAGMIVVHVRIQDQLHVTELESQLLHMLSDQRR